MNQKTIVSLALVLLAMRWLARGPRPEADLVSRLRLAGAL